MACNICGMSAEDGGCYNLCPNSPLYYSPEQERADEPFYGDDDMSERYAAERRDLEHEAQYVEEAERRDFEEHYGVPCPDCGDSGRECDTHYNWETDDIPF